MKKECNCDEENICSEHFWERYKETPQYAQQYGGPKNAAGIGWVGNCLGMIKGRRDDEDD
jgi:hypothetical protein